MSYTSLTYHIVFSTYRRMPVIDIEHERELYKFLYDLASSQDVKIWRIGGMPDHVHILCDIPSNKTVAGVVRFLKAESAKFMRVNSHFPLWVKWSEGYGAFTIDASSRETRIIYIKNQKEHHKRVSFMDEIKKLFAENGIEAQW